MPFSGAVSNQSSIRSGASFERHLIIHTPDIICQVQPSSGASGLSNAVITVGTPTSGAVADIKTDYTVFVTPTSDYANDLQYRQSECLVTYARLDGNGSSIYIGETTFQWATSQYVTVVRDVRVHQRRLRYISNTEYRDYGITYRTPKPRIYDLYHEALEITIGSTVSKSFTPSAEAMLSGATISSWLWDVDGNTISTGTSSSQNITVDFTAGTHIVSLTVTDSAGVSNKLSVLIAVIPLDYNSVLETGVVVSSLSHNENGHVAGLVKYNDIEPILPGSMAIVCTKVRYMDGTSTLHTDMVGWVGEINQTVLGDEVYQRIANADIALLDIAFWMQSIVLQSLPFEYKASPTQWGQFSRLTPLDMLWHIISELSTVASVATIDLPTTYTNQTVLALDSPNGTILDIARSLAFLDNKGAVQFAPNGELVFAPSLPYATSTVRDAATVYSDFSIEDTEFQLRYPPLGIFAVEYINAGATVYNTTSKQMRDFYGRAPAKTENGILEERIEFMVLPEDTTATSAVALTGQLSFDHWDASNENLIGELTFKTSGYIGLRQNQNAWITLDISAGDLPNSDITFDSNTRFIVNAVNQEYDPGVGSLSLNASIRLETGGKANYSVVSQELLASVFQANLAPVPNTPAYPYLEESSGDDASDDIYGSEYTNNASGMTNPGSDPREAIEESNNPSSVNESISVPLTGETVTTSNTFSSGSNYLITFSGSGTVNDEWRHHFDFTESSEGFVAVDVDYNPDANFGAYESGAGWKSSGVSGFRHVVYIYLSHTLTTITSIESTVSITPSLFQTVATDGDEPNQFTGTGGFASGEADAYGIFLNAQESAAPGPTYDGYITGATVTGKGNNPFGSSNDFKKGDAFFTYYEGETPVATGGAAGIKKDGLFIALASVEPSAYSGGHSYSYVVTGSDTTMSFQWVDPDGSTDENNGSIQVTIREVV